MVVTGARKTKTGAKLLHTVTSRQDAAQDEDVAK